MKEYVKDCLTPGDAIEAAQFKPGETVQVASVRVGPLPTSGFWEVEYDLRKLPQPSEDSGPHQSSTGIHQSSESCQPQPTS